jgi:hypothetical protein
VTVAELLRWPLVAVLLAAAAAKLAAGRDGRRALRSFGLRDPRLQAAAWSTLVAVEAGLAAALALRLPGAAEAAAAAMASYALALLLAVARGGAGRPCGCFGRRSRIGRPAALRALLLAGSFAALPALAHVRPGGRTWVEIGLAASLAGVAACVVAILALARELGRLRLALGPQAALTIEGEGPELGGSTDLMYAFDGDPELALAVFSSRGCRLCAGIEPAVRVVATEPGVAVATFDEQADRDAWRSLDVPGAPYGVVLDAAGTVLAKGTFNTLAQLEGLLAAAERRRARLARV